MCLPKLSAMSFVRLAVALFLALGCGGESREQTLDVYAASSLRPAFDEIAEVFEADHPGWTLRCNYAGSQVLRMQIEEGGRADVFASADALQMRRLLSSREGVESVEFASNGLVLAVTPESQIRSFEELPRASRLVIGTAASPIGAYARQLFARANTLYANDFEARTLAAVVSEESNAGLVRAKVELGAADAAIIYASDTQSVGFRVIAPPAELRVAAPYQVAVLRDYPPARAFAELLQSQVGRSILTSHAFIVDVP